MTNETFKIKLNCPRLDVKKLMRHNFIDDTCKLLEQYKKGTLQKKQNDPTIVQPEYFNLQSLSFIIIDVSLLRYQFPIYSIEFGVWIHSGVDHSIIA